MEGKDGVPLRFPRPVMALIATGTAAISITLAAVPASADQVRHSEWWLGSLGVTSAWFASHGSGVTVAVLSDGVVASHPDLAGAVTKAGAIAGAPVATGQYAGELGTSIASLIAGRGHGAGEANGIVGVAPQARILSVPVTLPPDDPQLSQSSVAAAIPGAIAAGIRYAVAHGATVIDLPIDPGQASSNGVAGATGAAGGSAAEQAAVSYALAHNVVLVAPAGDDYTAGDAANYPAAYPGVIAVGAFDSQFNKAGFSSRQHYVTLTASGAGVAAASRAGGYVTMNSTSAASAVVAGIVALIRSRYPSLTVAQVRQVLISTTTYRRAGGLATGSGYGAVDAAQAMVAAAALGTPPSDRASAGTEPLRPPAVVTASPARPSLSAQVTRAGEISGGVLAVLLLLIAAYAAVGRRRSRRQTAVTAEWTHHHAQSRYPQASSTDADRMLEVFAVPAPVPVGAAESTRGPGQSADLVRYHRGADGVFAPTAGRPLASASGGSAPFLAGASGRAPLSGPLAISGAPVASGSAGAGGNSDNGWPSLGPASRAVSGHAVVSGAPPWEPAAPPDGELPWTAGTGKHGASARGAITSPAAQSGVAQPSAVQASAVQLSAAQSAAARSQAAQPQPPRRQTAQPPSDRPQPAQPPSAQPRPAQARPARSRAARRQAAKSAQVLPAASAQVLPAAPAQVLPTASAQVLPTAFAQGLPTRAAQGLPGTAAPGLPVRSPQPAPAPLTGPPATNAPAGRASGTSQWSAANSSPSRPTGHRATPYSSEPPGWDAIPPDLRRVSEPPDWDAIPPTAAAAGQPGWDPSVRPSTFDPERATARSSPATPAATPQKFEWPMRYFGRSKDRYDAPSPDAAPSQHDTQSQYDPPAADDTPTPYDTPSSYDSPPPYDRRSPSLHGASAGPSSPGFRSPSGFVPGADADPASRGFDAPARYGPPGAASSSSVPGEFGNAAPGALAGEPDTSPAPRYAPSGLPVRQPRAERPANPAPLSPSGSLWEPARGDTTAEPADPGTGGRPIFTWNPDTTRDSAELDDTGVERRWRG